MQPWLVAICAIAEKHPAIVQREWWLLLNGLSLFYKEEYVFKLLGIEYKDESHDTIGEIEILKADRPQWSIAMPTEPGWYWVKVKKQRDPQYLTICDWDYLTIWLRGVCRFEIIGVSGPIPQPEGGAV